MGRVLEDMRGSCVVGPMGEDATLDRRVRDHRQGWEAGMAQAQLEGASVMQVRLILEYA